MSEHECRSLIRSSVSNQEDISSPTSHPPHLSHRNNFINLPAPLAGMGEENGGREVLIWVRMTVLGSQGLAVYGVDMGVGGAH